MDAAANYFKELYVELKDPWALIGWVGQLFFSSRFIVQWIATERKKQSIIPVSFWYLSIVGSLLLLVYGFYIKKPVYIVGYLFNSVVYVRNLYFIYKKK
ncbi:MAG: lipid-A-disaccharide synthase N-terminal domain-containing protein, partial [Candidatus Aureabacteria bacterium]|nr:lipid-A-disaccharide synthase N-terminal domain-containing protein [Candidatus Auribacterota bacterium]